MFKHTKLKFSMLFALTSILFISASDYKFLFFIPALFIVPFIQRNLSSTLRKGVIKKIFEAFPLIFFIFCLIADINLFYTLSNLLVIILFVKQILPRTEKDYYEIFLVGVLLILLSSVSTISLSFAILLFVFLASGTLMLIVSGIEKEEIKLPHAFYRKILLFSLISMFFSFALFFSFPRLSLGYFHGIKLSPQTESGFSTDVVIEKGEVKLDNRVLMRIYGKYLTPPVYISGLHYSNFDGKRWVKEKHTLKLFPYDSNNDFGLTSGMAKSTVFLEPNGTDVLFGPDKLIGIHGEFIYLRRNKFGDFLTDQTYYKTIKYDTYSSMPGKSSILIRETLNKKSEKEYLELPPLPDKLKSIAIVASGNGKTTEQKANNIANFLRKNYKYSLNPSATDISDFLINKKTGYCEHFTTAFVLLARINGIPSRLVSGFVTSEYNPKGNYFIVREKDAHTWAEIYVQGKGWVRVDPTPHSPPQKLTGLEMIMDNIRMSWYRNVITYNSTKQTQMLSNLRKGISKTSFGILRTVKNVTNVFRKKRVLIVAILIVILLFIMFKKTERKEDFVLHMIEIKIGKDKKKGETLLEFASRKGKLKEFYHIIMLYYKLRFSKEMNGKNRTKLIEEISDIVKEIT